MQNYILTGLGNNDILIKGLAKMRERRKTMNIDRIRGKMTELHITGTEMAAELGMDPSTFYRKIKNNGKDFSVADLYTFSRVLKMDKSEAAEILLS